jgi:hypothetical protein
VLYLDDRLPTHPKILEAGARLKKRTGDVFLFYVMGIIYARTNLTDGFIPNSFVDACGVVARPQAIAKVFVDRHIGLWRKVAGGYQIHDYHDWNPKSSEIKQKRARDRARKAAERAADNGAKPKRGQGVSTMDRSRTRARASHETMNPWNHDGRTTDNQPKAA